MFRIAFLADAAAAAAAPKAAARNAALFDGARR
jgi:hypothetical protein